MRIALVLSGQPRYFEKGFEYIKKNIIDVDEPDIFFHTWHQQEKVGQKFGGVSWTQDSNDIIKENTPKRLLELYNPKYFKIESQKYDLFPDNKTAKDYPDTQGENIAFQNFSMFYSMYEAMELCAAYERDNKFKYDCVIRCRFDAAPLSPIDLKSYSSKELSREIMYTDSCRNKAVMSDWCFWSSSKNMRMMCAVYTLLDRYVFGEGVMLCGEEILTHHLKKIFCIRNPRPISLFLVRDSEFKNREFGVKY